MSPLLSIWRDPAESSTGYLRPEIVSESFPENSHFDTVVIGAGLTGLVTAVLFARAGHRVAVLEAREVGAGTTGNTTAKLSLLQGTMYTSVLRHTSRRVGRAYVEGNRAAFEWMTDFCRDRNIPVQRCSAFSYAHTAEGLTRVHREVRAARRLGVDARFTSDAGLPVEHLGAAELPDQAQFNPMDVLAELAAELRTLGGVLVEHTRVRRVRASQPVIVDTAAGRLRATRVIVATGAPILDRGLYWAKTVPMRSYSLAFRLPGTAPSGMHVSVDEPSRSIRTAEITGETRLLVGGAGHVTGRAKSPRQNLDELEAWTAEHFPGAVKTHEWSAQDYQPVGRIPFVGWMPRGRGRVFVATGYNKWGMTNAVAAALTLVGDVSGSTPAWAATLHHRITTPMDAASFITAGLSTGWWALKEYANAWRTRPVNPREGEGIVSSAGLQPVATCTIAGVTRSVSAVCPHLGGVLTWNDGERSWDCPLHGSRFAADGALLEGPATRDLAPRAPIVSPARHALN